MKISISKEQLSALARVSFTGKIHVVDTLPKLDKALAELKGATTLGFDTETRPSFKKGISHNVALMQISTMDDCYLLRINKIGIPTSLRLFLEDSQITKVGLSLKDDFGVIHKGYDANLQKIYAILFGKRISKGQRLSNWEADTLTVAQQEYAAIDAWACLKIYNYLNSQKFNPEESEYIIHEENED